MNSRINSVDFIKFLKCATIPLLNHEIKQKSKQMAIVKEELKFKEICALKYYYLLFDDNTGTSNYRPTRTSTKCNKT